MAALTTHDYCVLYFESAVLPCLRDECNIDAQNLCKGSNSAWIPFGARKDFEDVKGYNGIGVSVDAMDNPNIGINALSESHTISGCIVSKDKNADGQPKNRRVFIWKSLVEMVNAINELK